MSQILLSCTFYGVRLFFSPLSTVSMLVYLLCRLAHYFSNRIKMTRNMRALASSWWYKMCTWILWQTWLHILTDIKKSTHCKHVPCNALTHSTNEDLLNIKRKGDPKSRNLSRTSDTTETRNPCVIKVILLACFTYIDIF